MTIGDNRAPHLSPLRAASDPSGAAKRSPKVSIVSPVYNGGRFLVQAIESVLDQHYENWDYTILDNNSTDNTPDIAAAFAARDPRIRHVRNAHTLPMLENWNMAMRLMAPDCDYVKVLHADDWMEPDCLARMVEVGEEDPEVGVISAQVMEGAETMGQGLTTARNIFTGAEVCRPTMLGKLYVFGGPSALLLRAEAVRRRLPGFYDPSFLHADLEVCYALLKEWKFGYVHRVLTNRSLHDASVTNTFAARFNTHMVEYIGLLWRHGPDYLHKAELTRQSHAQLRRYRRLLARRVISGRGMPYWRYHRSRMEEFGYELGPRDLALGILSEVGSWFLHPREAWDLLVRHSGGGFRPRISKGA